ncbi:LuxR C-terminal-related transcriptional regulator [Streptomyces sp. BE147]|uniref:helix-turn-helix transcriptional regulator n=1 Tax=unclassified Streptomyces TaxID=2593676 RepID=UPI002E77819E|nr:LuxR C-terminal-related transcriptional regulator [Streptomyces sp. BE147]MEE1742624.1 LuxR C-terminal-related transcriptional regulator [Streptomyces sp. BE147]
MLEAVGVSAFDEDVYRAVLSGPRSAVRDLAENAGAGVARTGQALRRLAGLGLVRRVGRGQWEAVSPQSALSALLNRRRSEAETVFAGVETEFADLHRLHRAGQLHSDPGALVEVLTGREVTARKIEELNRSVTTHLWTLDKPPYLEPVGQPHFHERETATTREWAERGVDIRGVYCLESIEPPGRLETLLELAALGERSRLLPHLPFKARIVDRRVAVVLLTGGSQDSIVLVHPSGLLDGLMELFEAYWEQAEPLLSERPDSMEGPSQEELMLLRLLHAGCKDKAIARQLGVSVRTATRRVGALMRRLDAGTRFQAGVRARERGWV